MTLKDRYLAAVLRSIPEEKRDDVRNELSAAIDDAVDGRVDGGEAPGAAERAVLTEFGDPARLASEYADRPLWLIGPDYYLAWLRLLKKLLAIVPIAVAVGIAALRLVSGGELAESIGAGIGAAITAAFNVGFWVTAGFVIAERSGGSVEADLEPLTRWNVDKLPDLPERQISYGETIGSLVVLGLVVLAIFGQRQLAPEPFLAPGAWSVLIPVTLGLIGLAAIVELVKLRVGHWTMGLATANAAANVVFAGWWLWMLTSDRILNPGFFEALGLAGSTTVTSRVMAAVIVIISALDTGAGFIGARKAAR